MFSLPNDIISAIAEFFINKDVSTFTIHKFLFMDTRIGKIFGKKYIEYLQKKHKVTDIYDIAAKELHKRSILNYPIVKEIKNQIELLHRDKIIFENSETIYDPIILSQDTRNIIYLFAIYYEYIWFESSYWTPSMTLKYQGFFIHEIRDEKDHKIYDLKKKRVYFEGFFTHQEKNLCRWKKMDEIYELPEIQKLEKSGFPINLYNIKIKKYCTKIKLIKI